MQFDDPLQFWSIFSAAMNENPPPSAPASHALRNENVHRILPQRTWRCACAPPTGQDARTSGSDLPDEASGFFATREVLGWIALKQWEKSDFWYWPSDTAAVAIAIDGTLRHS